MTIRAFVKKTLGRAIFETNTYRFLSLTIPDSWPYVPLGDYLNIDKLLLFWKVSAHALQNYASLSMAYDLTALVEKNKLAGAIVECGVWRGGCAAVMATVADKAESNRRVWLFDSFEGMPAATKEDVGEEAKQLSRGVMSGALSPVGTLMASVDEVRTLLFKKLRLKEDNITIVKGWFQNTLPLYRDCIGAIAILRVDGDWYESTKVCLESLYDNVVNEGYIIIDDYGFYPGCKKAVDDFLERRRLKVQLTRSITLEFISRRYRVPRLWPAIDRKPTVISGMPRRERKKTPDSHMRTGGFAIRLVSGRSVVRVGHRPCGAHGCGGRRR